LLSFRQYNDAMAMVVQVPCSSYNNRLQQNVQISRWIVNHLAAVASVSTYRASSTHTNENENENASTQQLVYYLHSQCLMIQKRVKIGFFFLMKMMTYTIVEDPLNRDGTTHKMSHAKPQKLLQSGSNTKHKEDHRILNKKGC